MDLARRTSGWMCQDRIVRGQIVERLRLTLLFLVLAWVTVAVNVDDCPLNSNCHDTTGSFYCTCHTGWDGEECIDINECTGSPGQLDSQGRPADNTCHTESTCINNLGSFICDCNPGWAGPGTICTNIDECGDITLRDCRGNTFTDARCAQIATAFSKTATNCFDLVDQFAGDGECQDDVVSFGCAEFGCDGGDCECNAESLGNYSFVLEHYGNNTCSEESTCVDSDGSYECECNLGWTGSGITCMDFDECALGLDDCSDDATCANEDGSFTCTCNLGFFSEVNAVDGTSCTACDAMSTDLAAGNEMNCACNAGWSGPGITCVDVDECTLGLDDCSDDAACADEDGSVTCTGNLGFLSEVNAADGTSCTACDLMSTDLDTGNEMNCVCNLGWSGSGITCVDVDECALDIDDCDDAAPVFKSQCTDIDGSFTCACTLGWTGTGVECDDVTECSLGLNDCDLHASCAELEGSFACNCNAGYAGDGTICFNKNETNDYIIEILHGTHQSKGGQTGFLLESSFQTPESVCLDQLMLIQHAVTTQPPCVDLHGPVTFADGSLVPCGYLSQWECSYDLRKTWSYLEPGTTVASRCPLMCGECADNRVSVPFEDENGYSCDWYTERPERCTGAAGANRYCCACNSTYAVPIEPIEVALPTLWTTSVAAHPDFSGPASIGNTLTTLSGPPTGIVTVQVNADDTLTMGYALEGVDPTLSAALTTTATYLALTAGEFQPTGAVSVVDMPNSAVRIGYSFGAMKPALITSIHTYVAYSGANTPSGTVTVLDLPGGAIEVVYTLVDLVPDDSDTLEIHTGLACDVPSEVGANFYDAALTNPWTAQYTADANGVASGSFTVSTGKSYSDNDGHVVIINGGNDRAGCGVLAARQSAVKIHSGQTCDTAGLASPVAVSASVAGDPWDNSLYTVLADGTAAGQIVINSGMGFDANNGLAVVLYEGADAVACGTLSPVQIAIEIKSGFSCSSTSAIGGSTTNHTGTDPVQVTFPSTTEQILTGSMIINNGGRYFENKDRAVVVYHDDTAVGCTTLTIGIVPFYWTCIQVIDSAANITAPCTIRDSLDVNQVILPNELAGGGRYQFTVTAHIDTDSSARSYPTTVDILDEVIPVSIAYLVDNTTAYGATAKPWSTIAVQAVLNYTDLEEGGLLEHEDLEFEYVWTVNGFDFSEHTASLEGNPALTIPNNDQDPRFTAGTTVQLAVNVTAFVDRLGDGSGDGVGRNVYGYVMQAFEVPPSPAGGAVAVTEDPDGTLQLSTSGWIAPAGSSLSYAFYFRLPGSTDNLYFSTHASASAAFEVSLPPANAFTVGVEVSYFWGRNTAETQYTQTVDPGEQWADTLETAYADMVLYLANDATSTIKSAGLQAFSLDPAQGQLNGTQDQIESLYAEVLASTVTLYARFRHENAREIIVAGLDRIAALTTTLAIPPSETLRAAIFTAVDTYITNSLEELGGDIRAGDLVDQTKLINKAIDVFAVTAYTPPGGSVLTIEHQTEELLAREFEAIEALVTAGRGPDMPGVHVLVADSLGVGAIHPSLEQVELDDTGSAAVTVPGVENRQLVDSSVQVYLVNGVPGSVASVRALYRDQASFFERHPGPTSSRADAHWTHASATARVRVYTAGTNTRLTPSLYGLQFSGAFSNAVVPSCHVWSASSGTWMASDTLVQTVTFSATSVSCEVSHTDAAVTVFTRPTGDDASNSTAPRGFFVLEGGFWPCPRGTYANSIGATSCTTIPVDYFCATETQMPCEAIAQCPYGYSCPGDGYSYLDGRVVTNAIDPWKCRGGSSYCVDDATPRTAAPTRAPTVAPTLSPTASDPTSSPTLDPTTSDPTQSPASTF